MRIIANVSATRETPEAVARQLGYSMNLEVGETTYEVTQSGDEATFSDTRPVTVAREPNLGLAAGAGLLSLGSLAGAGALILARRRGELALSAAEREWLEYRDDRTDYDDWITSVELPSEAESLPVARATTLADLVNVAIDSDNSVLETPDGGTYYVIHDGYRYTFEAPPEPPTAERTGEDDGTGEDESEGAEDAAVNIDEWVEETNPRE
jgi:hypothetical protein